MALSGKNLARWYRETSQHLNAGLPLPRALELAGGAPAGDRSRLAKRLLDGEPLETVLMSAPRWLPEVDRHAISAAGNSGQLVEILRLLADKREFAALQSRKAAAALAYPLFILHVALLVLPLIVVGIEDLGAYGRMVLFSIIPLWAGIAVLFRAVRAGHGWLHFLMRALPLLRGYQRNRSLAELSFTLRAYLMAGVAIDVAWAGAGRACGDRRLKRVADRVSDSARLGVPPGEQIEKGRVFPEDFVSLYRTGEMTGQLDDNLEHLWRHYDERAAAQLQAAGLWYPMLMLCAVALFVAYIVISAFAAYIDSFLELL